MNKYCPKTLNPEYECEKCLMFANTCDGDESVEEPEDDRMDVDGNFPWQNVTKNGVIQV